MQFSRCAVGVLVAMAGCLGLPIEESSTGVEAPAWSVGESWFYVITNATGAHAGSVRYTVIGESSILDAPAHRLRVDQTGQRGNGSHFTHYEKTTLNNVMDACDEDFVSGQCEGRSAMLNFPLEEGKNWTTVADSSDVPTGLNMTARKLPGNESRWLVTGWPQLIGGQGRIEILYGVQERFMLSRVQFDADGRAAETWTLSPDPTAPKAPPS